jgi:YD repeat-containing protein
MLRCNVIRIGFITAVIMLSAHSLSLSQKADAPQMPSGEALLVMRFAPGKWYHEVQGDVREIVTTQFRLTKKDGKLIETRINSKTVSFDRRGFQTEEVEGEEGRTLWKYDAQGKVVEMNMSLSGVPFAREVYHYDFRQRKITVETYFWGGDRLRSREVSTFDEKWNEVRKESESFGEDGKATEQEKHVVIYKTRYDSKGRAIVSTIGGEDDSISHKFTNEYADSDYLVKSISYEYDQASGALISKSVNTYDGRGHLLTSLNYDPRGRLLRRESYTREFDAKGNWITEKQTTWANDGSGAPGSFTRVKRRKITFY